MADQSLNDILQDSAILQGHDAGISTVTTPTALPKARRGLMTGMVVCVAALAGCLNEQDTGIDSLITACTPIAATGSSIRADLSDAGWSAKSPQDGRADLRDILGSHMWGFAPDAPHEAQLAQVDQYVPAFLASLNDPEFGQIYTRDGEVAVVLSQGVNLTCLWAGPDSDAFAARVSEVGGFPQVEDSAVTTAARTQTVEADGQDWTRIESYATLTQEGRTGPYPAAARLDRSPAQ